MQSVTELKKEAAQAYAEYMDESGKTELLEVLGNLVHPSLVQYMSPDEDSCACNGMQLPPHSHHDSAFIMDIPGCTRIHFVVAVRTVGNYSLPYMLRTFSAPFVAAKFPFRVDRIQKGTRSDYVFESIELAIGAAMDAHVTIKRQLQEERDNGRSHDDMIDTVAMVFGVDVGVLHGDDEDVLQESVSAKAIERDIAATEAEIMAAVDDMCIESISPELHGHWLLIKNALIAARPALHECDKPIMDDAVFEDEEETRGLAGFYALVELLMVSDPWPLNEDNELAVKEYVNNLAIMHGGTDWVSTYMENVDSGLVAFYGNNPDLVDAVAVFVAAFGDDESC